MFSECPATVRRRVPYIIIALAALALSSLLARGDGRAAGMLRTVQSSTAHPDQHAAGLTTSVRNYFVAIGDNGRAGTKIGCGDSLIAVRRPTAPTHAPLRAALHLLLNTHRRTYGQSGLYNALYRSRLRVQSLGVSGGMATVRLAGTMQLGGVCDDPRVGAQLRYTVRQFSTVQRVAIFVNGVPLWKRLSEK